MMECYSYSKNEDGSQGPSEIIKCNQDKEEKYCFMIYSITEENYNIKTKSIIDPSKLIASVGKCIDGKMHASTEGILV